LFAEALPELEILGTELCGSDLGNRLFPFPIRILHERPLGQPTSCL